MVWLFIILPLALVWLGVSDGTAWQMPIVIGLALGATAVIKAVPECKRAFLEGKGDETPFRHS